MPVYVTRAHVTIGDAGKRLSQKRRPVPKHAFQVSDICKTPYCLRACFVSLFGAAIVAGGVIMTIIGYKPSIIIPWYSSVNLTQQNNNTDPTSVPKVLGEPGPLRILVYIGPTLMGIGFFMVMMTVVLFCEIKDRYFNNILPKPRAKESIKKDHMYDMIIEEFRKNYFRGIEVPLQKHTERRKSKRFSLSLSRSGSIMSFGRRLSQDILQKRKRKHSRESQSERVSSTKWKRSTLKRILDPDSWMKTSSLPNITNKGSLTEMHKMHPITTTVHMSPKGASKSCGPHLNIFNISDETSGVDNPAYRDSPPDKRNKPVLTKHQSLDHSAGNLLVTTVLVHRELNNEDCLDRICPVPLISRKHESVSEYSEGDFKIDINSDESIIDIDRDIQLIPKSNEDVRNIPVENKLETKARQSDRKCFDDKCTCGTDIFCTTHTLGMDSSGSSLSLSWDNVPCEWNDARRNTEPHVLYQTSFSTETEVNSNTDQIGIYSKSDISSNSGSKEVKSNSALGLIKRDTANHRERKLRRAGPYKTKIGVFKSDSNLLRVGTYSLLSSFQNDSISLDSLELSDDMLKNFEMTETAYI